MSLVLSLSTLLNFVYGFAVIWGVGLIMKSEHLFTYNK